MEALASYLVNLNRSLVADPPPPEELTGSDICYLGANGEEDVDKVVFCKDLPFGMRGVVGSWFISPEQHINEMIIATIASMSIIFIIRPFIIHKTNNTNKKNTTLRPPQLMRIATAVTFILQVLYKAFGYEGKILMMILPCNLLWILAMVLCFYPNLSPQASNIICQIWVGYMGLPLLALAVPDFSDSILFGEVYFFIYHHFFLLFYGIYYVIISGKVSLLPDVQKGEGWVGSFLKWNLLTCACMILVYYPIATPLSVWSGLNLNYMLHPPPNQDDLVGLGYRLTSNLYLAIMFTLMRVCMMAIEIMCIRLGLKKSKVKRS